MSSGIWCRRPLWKHTHTSMSSTGQNDVPDTCKCTFSELGIFSDAFGAVFYEKAELVYRSDMCPDSPSIEHGDVCLYSMVGAVCLASALPPLCSPSWAKVIPEMCFALHQPSAHSGSLGFAGSAGPQVSRGGSSPAASPSDHRGRQCFPFPARATRHSRGSTSRFGTRHAPSGRPEGRPEVAWRAVALCVGARHVGLAPLGSPAQLWVSARGSKSGGAGVSASSRRVQGSRPPSLRRRVCVCLLLESKCDASVHSQAMPLETCACVVPPALWDFSRRKAEGGTCAPARAPRFPRETMCDLESSVPMAQRCGSARLRRQTDVARIWHQSRQVGRSRPKFGRNRPSCAGSWPELAEFRGRHRSNRLAEVGRGLLSRGPNL